ncbi:MFS transporter [Salinarchaeum laminariae]|uniref:MFS transporter n=1 Tax=Salinarchaeum laminariae TaxID=869888 RepID=UPI0020C0BAB4|nr:MFS transporter [Salinarchaeum laminariae]
MNTTTRRTIGRYDALLLASLLWFLAKLLRYAFPPLLETLGAEYDVSTAALGSAFTAFMLVYAAVQFPSGVLADRIGPVRVLVAGALIAAVGAFAVVVSGPFLALVGAMIFLGLGTGAHKTVAIGLLTRVYPARSGRALGVHDTFGTFGGVLAPAIVAMLLASSVGDWRALFLVGGGVAVLLAGATAVRVPRHLHGADSAAGDPSDDHPSDGTSTEPADGTAHGPGLAAYAAPFRDPGVAGFVALTLCFSFAYSGVVAFLPLYLARVAGASTTTASLLYGLLFAVSVVQLGTGELSDRVGRLSVILATIGLATVALVALVLVPDVGPEIAGVPMGTAVVVAAFGIGSHGFRPVRAAHLESILPEALAGGGLGAVRTALMGAAAVSPAVVGIVADSASFRAAFALLLVALAAALVLAASLWRSDR